jgi:hypothetical protein
MKGLELPMTLDKLDISDSLTWEEDLPRPQWDLINTWVESQISAHERDVAWAMIGRQWLEKLGPALGRAYRVSESENFLLLAPQNELSGSSLLHFGEKCRQSLSALFDEIVEFNVSGKQVVLALKNGDDYYKYLSSFFPEGHHGGSAGIHIREGYPHIALSGTKLELLENTLAHEMTHASLFYLTLPQWIEEGLAQMFEHDMTSRALLQVNEAMARRHKRYWNKYGLEPFWRGEGFSQTGSVQALCYELAEILVRLLIEEYRPRWFGWNKEPRRRLFAFLREASAADCGQAAARMHLGLGLTEIAAWFLGPGEWEVAL